MKFAVLPAHETSLNLYINPAHVMFVNATEEEGVTGICMTGSHPLFVDATLAETMAALEEASA